MFRTAELWTHTLTTTSWYDYPGGHKSRGGEHRNPTQLEEYGRGYDETAKLVNASYARTQGIRQTMHNPVIVAISMTYNPFY